VDVTDRAAGVFIRHAPTRIMAAINASPESFYAGSVAASDDAIAKAVSRAEADGAELIDIGAMSTAPYKDAHVETEVEAERMARAVAAARRATKLPISADTQRAIVARAALDAGADIVNDVSALSADPGMATLIATRGAGAILMVCDSPSVVEEAQGPAEVVARLMREALARAIAAGIPPGRIMLDPGIGFFRQRSIPWHAWDMAVLGGIDTMKIGAPLLVGASRKSFLGEVLGRARADDRLAGSLGVAAWCVARGVEWLRVHDVAETRDVIRIIQELSPK